MEDAVRQRIKKILSENHETINSISTGKSEQRRLNRQINEGANITVETILSIVDALPGVCIGWLLTGKEQGDENLSVLNKGGIPLYKIEAAAGFGSSNFAIEEKDVEARYKIKELETASFMLHVRGDSMMPTYNNGDIIAVKTISDARSIQWGKPHLLSSAAHGILVKRIYDDGENIVCVSDNHTYKPIYIEKNDITGIAIVMGSVKFENY